MSLSACQNSQYQRGVLFLLGGVNDDPAGGAVDEALHCTAVGAVRLAEVETVDDVLVDIGGVGDSKAETAIDCDNWEIDNVTSGIESREVGDISVDTTVVGVSDSRAEAAIDDGKCEVDNVTPGIVGDIPVDTTVGEDNAEVVGMTADSAAGVREGEINDFIGGTVDSTVDEGTCVVDVITAGAAADDRTGEGEVNDVTTGTVVDGNDDNVGVAAEAADVGIVEGDASQNRNCDCFSFL